MTAQGKGRRPPPPLSDERVEQRLLAIAADHIRRHGLAQVRLVAIARDAGMSHANVYRFFAGKDALLEGVVVAWMRGLEVALGDVANAADPADDKLERFLIAWARAMRDALERDPAVFAAFASYWEVRAASVLAHRARLRGYMEAIVEEGLEPGPFRLRDEARAVAFVADAMQRFVHPVLVTEAREISRAQIDARLAAVIRVVIRALRAGGL